jgi:hypothetical protein
VGNMTTSATDYVVAGGGNSGGSTVLNFAGPYSWYEAANSYTSGAFSGGVEGGVQISPGTFPTYFSCPTGGGLFPGIAVAFKGATSSGSAPWSKGPIVPSDVSPVGIGPIYNASGVLQNINPHSIVDSCTTSGGTCTVTFTGSSIYSSATSYHCNVDMETAQPSNTSGSVVVLSSSAATPGFDCHGD